MYKHINKNIFKPDYFISLGENCLSAGILKYCNLRIDSNLFDWASCEKFEIIENILKYGCDKHIELNIKNNFNMILSNKNYYKKNKFPRDKIIYVHHPNKEYQIRCALRFFEKINNKNKVVFVFSYGRNFKNININKIQKLVNLIQKYNLENFIIIVLEYTGDGKEIFKDYEDKHIIKYKYKTPTPPPFKFNNEEKYKWNFFIDFFKNNILSIYK